jgi:hypothetical protein
MAMSRVHCICAGGLYNAQSLTHLNSTSTGSTFNHCLPSMANECGEQGDRKTCAHETSDSDDRAQRTSLNWWNHGSLTGGSRLIRETAEDGAEEGRRLLIRILLEVRRDIKDKNRADSREQTRLWEQMR